MKTGEKFQGFYKVHRIVYQKRNRLLDMEYTTNELAEELGVTPKYVRDTMIAKHGAPFKQDKKGRVWLEGIKIRDWIEEAYNPNKNKVKLDENEFYCVKCREKRLTDHYNTIQKGGTIYKQSHCPICGTLMNKISGREF